MLGPVTSSLVVASLMIATATALPAYPPSRREDVVETLHGQPVVDPYRWLENGGAPEVEAWTAAESAYTRRLIDALPGRSELSARLWAVHEIGSLGAPVQRPRSARGSKRARAWRYFYTRRDGKQNQAVLYVRDGLDGGDRPLVDVNALAADGTRSLDWWFPSEDGARVAYGLSADGSEESVLHVRDVASGADLPDTIDRTRACSVAWLPDGSGFYYTRYPAKGAVPDGEERYHRQVFFHRLGAPPSADEAIFGAGRDKTDWPSVALSPNGRYLAISVSEGWSRSELYVVDRGPRAGRRGAKPAPSENGRLVPIATGVDALFNLEEITDDALYVRTNEGAPRYRLARVPLGGDGTPPPRETWRELLGEGPNPLEQVALVGGGATLAALYLEDAASRVRLFDAAGRPAGEIALPALGTVAGLTGHPEGSELFVPFTSFLSPTTILRQKLAPSRARGASRPAAGAPAKAPVSVPAHPPLEAATVWRALASPVAAADFVVTRDEARSKDGTAVPLFVVHRRDLVRGPDTPTVIGGYGGFNVNMAPGWAPSLVPFLERGGAYVLAILRGGGEYGEAWHQAGMRAHKQNVFDDFAAAAQHLIDTRTASAAHLGIIGRSNGGLLIGAAITQHPELYRAAICGVPLLDMLRYHRFSIAELWIPEYGSADDAEGFAWLRAYSPYHHVREGVTYPAVMFSTAASDTRVDPLHARKMTARMQAAAARGSGRPVLLRLETKAGHGAGKPLGKVIDQLVDEWSFLFAELGVPGPGDAAAPGAGEPR